MSWKEYVETQLVATGAVKQAMIISAEDGNLWAAHPSDFVPRAYRTQIVHDDGTETEELINEAADLASIGKTLHKPKAGLRINQTKYLITRTMPSGINEDGLKTVYFKKPKGGGCLCVTNLAIVIGIWDEGTDASHCNLAVENLSRYLKKNNC